MECLRGPQPNIVLAISPLTRSTTHTSADCCSLGLTMANAATALTSAVFIAADRGEARAVAVWLDGGGGVDTRSQEYDGATLLMAAASGGQEAMVRMLLQRGASVNLQDSHGTTALMRAALRGHTKTMQALLDAKADAALQAKSGYTAIMFAEHRKHTATAQLLRQHAKRQAAEANLQVLLEPAPSDLS